MSKSSFFTLRKSSKNWFDPFLASSTDECKRPARRLAFLFSADALKVNFHKQTKEIKRRCAAATFALSKWERRDQRG